MSLKFPRDLDAWQAWDRGRHPVREVAARTRRSGSTGVWAASSGPDPVVAVVLDDDRAASQAALLEPLRHLPDVPALVLAPFDLTGLVPAEWTVEQRDGVHLGRDLPAGKVVLASGGPSPLARAVHTQAQGRGTGYVVVQTGLLTPFSAPLPDGARVLTWTAPEGEFWASGRDDVTATPVGSQLLWRAASRPAGVSDARRPLYLGQLQASELPSAGMLRAAVTFCQTTHGVYRPHPAETGHLARMGHAALEGLGIEIDRSGTPLDRVNRPVASAFSTGILEAAARGVPSYVWYPRAPSWLQDLWGRYGMRPWGAERTPAPTLPRVEPARAVADVVTSFLRPAPAVARA